MDNTSPSSPPTTIINISTDANLSLINLIPAGCVLKQVTRDGGGSGGSGGGGAAASSLPWEDPDVLVPKEVESLVNVVFMGLALPLCFLLSLGTNAVNMAVFWTQGLKERINMLLFSLALLDLLYVAAIYALNSDVLYMFIVGKGGAVKPVQAFFFKHNLLGFIGSGSASQVVSSVIALERCLCVARPLSVKNMLSTTKTALIVWCTVLLLIAGVFVSGMRYTVGCVYDPRNNSTFLQFFPSQFFLQNKDIIHFMTGRVYGMILPGVCTVCVTVCTVIIVVKMKKMAQWRESVSSASETLSSRDLAVTRMIVGTSVLFIVCLVPSVTVRVSVTLVPGLNLGGRYANLYSVLLKIHYMASVGNSSFNFFVYYFYGSKFRQTVHQLFKFLPCGGQYHHKQDGHKLAG